MRDIRSYIVAAAALVTLASHLVHAQSPIDPSTTLVGRWEGQIEYRGTGRGRGGVTLVIDSVQASQAEGRYGEQGSVQSVNIIIEQTDAQIVLKFSTAPGREANLTLQGGKRLVGQYRSSGLAGGGEVPMWFEKVR